MDYLRLSATARCARMSLSNISWLSERVRFSIAAVFVLIAAISSPASHAGLFDQIAEEAKKAMGGAVDDIVNDRSGSQGRTYPAQKYPPRERQQVPVSQTQNPKPTPQYDHKLVADIQENLNRLGYSAGTVDGSYGAGTRKAIEQYQHDRSLRIDGRPTAQLLENMRTFPKETAVAVSTTNASDSPIKSKNTHANNGSAGSDGNTSPLSPAYADETKKNYLLTAVRLRPDLLAVTSIGGKKVDLLAKILEEFPEWFDIANRSDAHKLVNNEFEYPRRRAEFIEIVKERAVDAPMIYQRELSGGTRFNKYEFDREFYPFWDPISIKAVKPQQARQGWVLIIDQNIEIDGIDMQPEEAEEIKRRLSPGGNGGAKSMLVYRINGVKSGVEVGGNRETWLIDAEPIEIAFYMQDIGETDESILPMNVYANGAGARSLGISGITRNRKKTLHRVLSLSEQQGGWRLAGDDVNSLPATAAGHPALNKEVTPGDALKQEQMNEPASNKSDNENKYSVQGIATGMTNVQIAETLLPDGWRMHRQSQNNEYYTKIGTNKNKSLVITYVRNRNELKASNIKYRLTLTNSDFNESAVKGQMRSRYGEPVTEQPAGLFYKEYPDEASLRKTVVMRCKGEIMKNEPSMIESQALGKAQMSINMNEWENNGDDFVKENCPGALDTFNTWLEAMFGKTLDINITPRRVTMTLSEKGEYHRAQRQSRLQAQREADSIPEASMGASDF